MINAERLKLLIEFSKMDLANAREGDELNLKDDLSDLVAEPYGDIVLRPTDQVRKYTREHLKELQTTVGGVIKRLAENNLAISKAVRGGQSKVVFQPPTVPLAGDLSVNPVLPEIYKAFKSGSSPRNSVEITAGFDMCVLWAMFLLLQHHSNNVELCPECSGPFLRNRKQQYCSKACTNRVARRVWLQNPDNREKESTSAHKRYARRAKELKGNDANVVRRPRKKESVK